MASYYMHQSFQSRLMTGPKPHQVIFHGIRNLIAQGNGYYGKQKHQQPLNLIPSENQINQKQVEGNPGEPVADVKHDMIHERTVQPIEKKKYGSVNLI